MGDGGEEHQVSGATGGPAQTVEEEDRSEQHDTADRYSTLHGRAGGDETEF